MRTAFECSASISDERRPKCKNGFTAWRENPIDRASVAARGYRLHDTETHSALPPTAQVTEIHIRPMIQAAKQGHGIANRIVRNHP